MSLLNTLREVVGNNTFTVCECRNCGEKLPEDADECPNCGKEEIARYDF